MSGEKEWDKMTDEEKEKISRAVRDVLKSRSPEEDELLRARFGIVDKPDKEG
jgi:hypothetical protein